MRPRHRFTKRELIARLHRGLRPKLAKHQVQDLGLAHIGNLDTISRGEANEEILWQWVGGALTWSNVAAELEQRDPQLYREAAAAMLQQVAVVTSVVDRYRRTGRVGFSGVEYLQAKEACEWMDALAEVVDQPTAIDAVERSELAMNAMTNHTETST